MYDFQHLEYTPIAVRLTKQTNCKPKGITLVTAATYDTTDNSFRVVLNRKAEAIVNSRLFDALGDKTLVYMPDLKNIVSAIPLSNNYKVTPIIYRKTVQQIKITSVNANKTVWLRSMKALTSIDTTSYNIREFTKFVNTIRNLIREKLNINLDDYTSLPKMSYDAACKYGCFNNVYSVSGIIQAFAKSCIHGGLIRTLHGKCFEVDDVTCLDINSSYGTSMHVMQGIPKGQPKPFYNQIPNDACYALIQCNISNISSDKLGCYSFIKEGINFVDSIMLDEIKKYVESRIPQNRYHINKTNR